MVLMSFVLILISATASPVPSETAGHALELDFPLVCGSGTDAVFQYDDGSARWLTWGGLYRGTWFNIDDFVPGSTGVELYASEFWFYDGGWDTPFFFAEVYSGGSGGPETLIDETSACASHYCQVIVVYDPPLSVPPDFWVLENTEMSSGGYPSLLGDGSPQPVSSHSFYSDDFVVWEPWVVDQSNAVDYFIRAHGIALFDALESTTWGSIKNLF